MRVWQHQFLMADDEGRLLDLLVFSSENEWGKVRCLRCHALCMVVTKEGKDADGNQQATFQRVQTIHPTRDLNQHCARCCTGCTFNPAKEVRL